MKFGKKKLYPIASHWMSSVELTAKLCPESFAVGKATPTGCDAKSCTSCASDVITLFSFCTDIIIFYIYIYFYFLSTPFYVVPLFLHQLFQSIGSYSTFKLYFLPTFFFLWLCVRCRYYDIKHQQLVINDVTWLTFIVFCCSESRTDEDGRKRKLTMIFSIVVITLLVVAVVMVAIGLKFSSYIDEVCKSTSISLFLTFVFTADDPRMRISCVNGKPQILRRRFRVAFLRAPHGHGCDSSSSLVSRSFNSLVDEMR